jgi:hypothetical protein
MTQKLPAFLFYPGDWRKHPDLSRCCKAAKGMAIELLCLMHECEVRGVLSTAGTPWSDREIAAASGGDISENLTLLGELLTKKVFHRTTEGAVYSPRVVREEHLRQVRSQAGKIGGKRTGVLLKQNTKQNASKQPAKTGSSYSSSISSAEEDAGASIGTPGSPGNSLPHQPELPIAAPSSIQPRAAPAKTAQGPPKEKKSKRVRTDEEHRIWQQFRREFCEVIWPRHHGGEFYDFDSESRPERRQINYGALWRFLDHDAIGLDLERARQTADE